MKTLNLTTKINVYTFDEASESIKKLIEAAKSATKTAYAPYSEFCVGAAVMLDNGKIITGSNQENAAYPSGLCAERVAIFSANAQYPNKGMDAIAIAAFNKGDFTNVPCCPCGSCRQVMAEVESRYNKKVKIIMYGKSEIYEVDSIDALLPLSFGKKSLSDI